jgi:hypothetical protein
MSMFNLLDAEALIEPSCGLHGCDGLSNVASKLLQVIAEARH